MTGKQLGALFADTPEVPAELAAKIRAQISSGPEPAKSMMTGTVYAAVICGIFVMAALLLAFAFGLRGWRLLPMHHSVTMVCVLAALAFSAAAMAVRSMRPAGGRLYTGLSIALAFTAYEALTFNLFRDYSTGRFLKSGLLCLALGTGCAIVAAFLIWLVVRRGFIVEPVRAGALIGLVSGLAGLTGLTLHCDNLTLPHAGIWHAGLVLVCAGLGALAGLRVSASSTD